MPVHITMRVSAKLKQFNDKTNTSSNKNLKRISHEYFLPILEIYDEQALSALIYFRHQDFVLVGLQILCDLKL
jgi:hypothetical protein